MLVHQLLEASAARDPHAPALFEPAGRRSLKGFAVPVEVFSLTRA